MDIPGASGNANLNYEGTPTGGSDTGDSLFSGNLPFSYGTSPGHGMGYLMRSRRRNNIPLRPESRDLVHLHSHNELADESFLFDTDNNNTNSMEQGGFPSTASYRNEDPKSFTLRQEDLTAPLLPARVAQNKNGLEHHTSIESSSATQTTKAIVFGLINATASIPALVAYAAIVFRHPAYAPYVDLLCKFFFISSALHQTIFCLFSTIPFAMGQVQDVGIIFLSAMGTSIASLALDAGRDAPTALGTALLTMTLSTLIVGLGTLFVARRSLAEFVQFIPLPVMGGYLAFVGYFCIASGIGLGVSVEIGSLTSWSALFDTLPLIKLGPTLLSCVAMVVTLEKVQHPLALPTVLLALVGIFHIVLAISGISLKEAQEGGWVMPPAAHAVKFWDLWSLYHFENWNLSGIFFPAMWRQVAKTVGLLLVVIFGSCMDILAIQQDIPYKIDFNRELTTVAISNMATGIAGVGFTGSYIFSQTIFTMRAGVNSRINGWVIAGVEFFVFAFPYSIVQYLPNYFLGALLLWFGVEISRDWLILSYFKMTNTEYILLWMTFASIMQWGLEGGIAAGVVLATLYFAYAYARSQVDNFRVDRARSSVVRTVEHHTALELLWDSHVATAQLQGFVFFGSAQSIGAKLQEVGRKLSGLEDTVPEEQRHLEEAIQQSMRSTGEDYAGTKYEQALAALAIAPKFLVIDLSKVTGMDTSGARTLADTVRELVALGVTPILTGGRHHGIPALLKVNDVRFRFMRWPPELHPPLPPPGASPMDMVDTLSTQYLEEEEDEETYRGNLEEGVGRRGGDGDQMLSHAMRQSSEEITSSIEGDDEDDAFMFRSSEEGLRFCEDALLEVAVQFGLCTPPGAGTTLKECLVSHLEKLPLTAPKNADAMASTLRRYLNQKTVRRGEVLWQPEDPADEMFLIERGVIRVDQFRLGPFVQQYHMNENISSHGSRPEKVRSFELGPGCVAGSTDFYLARPHGTRGVCASVACRVLTLSRSALTRMAAEAPAALNVLQMAIMRANTSDLSTAADATAISVKCFEV